MSLYIGQKVFIEWNGEIFRGPIEGIGIDWLVVRDAYYGHVKLAEGYGIMGYFEEECKRYTTQEIENSIQKSISEGTKGTADLMKAFLSQRRGNEHNKPE